MLNNILYKDDRLMIKNLAISSALHIFLVVITAFTFPFIAKKPIDLPPLVSIELIQITDKTNIPFAPKAKKIIEKVKEKEKLVSEQAPPKQIKKEKPDAIPLPNQNKEIVKKPEKDVQNPEKILTISYGPYRICLFLYQSKLFLLFLNNKKLQLR